MSFGYTIKVRNGMDMKYNYQLRFDSGLIVRNIIFVMVLTILTTNGNAASFNSEVWKSNKVGLFPMVISNTGNSVAAYDADFNMITFFTQENKESCLNMNDTELIVNNKPIKVKATYSYNNCLIQAKSKHDSAYIVSQFKDKSKVDVGPLHFSAIGFNDEAVLININKTVSWGFKKEKQLNYKSIGAMDGWEGVWSGEKVELYQYSRSNNITLDVFEAEVLDQHGTNWFEVCQFKNLLMLSSGDKACKALIHHL